VKIRGDSCRFVIRIFSFTKPHALRRTPMLMTETPRSRWGYLGLMVILFAYCFLIYKHFAPAITEPDDNGYFAQGSLMAQTGRTWFKPESDAQYIGMHWLVTPAETYISRYPPGLAAIIAVVYRVGGYKASMLVNPALSIAALVAMFLLARRLIGTGWSLAATALLAFNPHFVHHALSGDSHIGVTCFLTWTFYFLVRWSQSPLLPVALLAGLCFGVVPTIRYPDSVMALGVAVFLLAQVRRVPQIWKHYGMFLIGAAIPVIPLLIRNQVLLGAFWRTGYALTNEQTGFSWVYFKEHALGYVQLLHSGGVGLLFPLGTIGIASMICMRGTRALGAMLALVCVPMLLLYMAYYWAPQMNSAATMRFLLPTFPAYVLAGIWMLATFLKDSPRAARIVVPITLLAIQGLWGATDLIDETQRIHYQKEMLARVTDKLDAVTQTGDVVVSNNQVLQNLDFVRKWKLADESLVRGGFGSGGGGPGGGRFGATNDPDSPSPMQREKREEQQQKYTGSTTQRENKFTTDVLTWAGKHKVYLIGSEAEVRDTMLPRGGDIKIVAKVEMPEAPVMQNQRGTGMAGPGGGGRGRGMGGPGMMGPGGQRGGFGAGPGGGGFGGPGGGGFRGPGGGGMGGGPMGMMNGERELVIAQWIPERNASVSLK
jgi:4-amino-4-deoxy-L-arabinose transferase-like glycosyltransferase